MSVKQMFDWKPIHNSWQWDVGGITNVGKYCKVTLSPCEKYLKNRIPISFISQKSL